MALSSSKPSRGPCRVGQEQGDQEHRADEHEPQATSGAAASATVPNTTIEGPGSYDMFNFNSTYTWDNYTFRFGIDNLLDDEPQAPQVLAGHLGLERGGRSDE